MLKKLKEIKSKEDANQVIGGWLVLLQLIVIGVLGISSKMDLYDLVFSSLTLSLNIIALFLTNKNGLILINITLILIFVYVIVKELLWLF